MDNNSINTSNLNSNNNTTSTNNVSPNYFRFDTMETQDSFQEFNRQNSFPFSDKDSNSPITNKNQNNNQNNKEIELDNDDFDDLSETKIDEGLQTDLIPSPQIYLERIKRRTLLIGEIRKAYLRDIVLLKHILTEYLTDEERSSIMTQWKKSIPSLDLRQLFMIYSPHESSLDIIPCETCGGTVEIVHHDSSEIQELSKALSHLDKNKNELRVMIAKKNVQIENIEQKLEDELRKHKEEKRFLYSQMKELRANDELLRAENNSLMERNQELKNENGEFKILNRDQLQIKEQLVQSKIEITRMHGEYRQLEEANENARDQIRLLSEKLQIQTMRADANAKQITNYQVEAEESKIAVQKYKNMADSLQKKTFRIENLLEEARKEVEDLRTAKSNLLLDLETHQNQTSIEIELLEATRDQLRLEVETGNDAIAELRSALTSCMIDRENLESNYETLLSTHKSYKAKTDEELVPLRKLPAKVSELEKRLNAAELDLEGYRLKDAPVDKEAVEKVKTQMRRLTQQVQVHSPIQDNEAKHHQQDKKRTDGRRVGVIVKDGRSSKSPLKVDTSNNTNTKNEGVIGIKTPKSALPRNEFDTNLQLSTKLVEDTKVENSVGFMKERLSLSNSSKSSKQPIIEDEFNDHINMNDNEDDNNDNQNDDIDDIDNLDNQVILENPTRYKPAPRKTVMRSVQPVRKTVAIQKDSKEVKPKVNASSTPISTSNNNKLNSVNNSNNNSSNNDNNNTTTPPSTNNNSGSNRRGSKLQLSSNTSKTNNPSSTSSSTATTTTTTKQGDDVKSSLQRISSRSNSRLLTPKPSERVLNIGKSKKEEEEQKENKDGSDSDNDNDNEDNDDDDAPTDMLGPPKVLLKASSMSLRRMTRLASLEDPIIPPTDNLNMLNKVLDTLVNDEVTATEAGIDDNLKNGLFRSLSHASSFSRLESGELSVSSRSNGPFEETTTDSNSIEPEEPEEIDEIEEEMSTDVAKTWGQFTKALNNVLSENLGEEIATQASHVIAPVTIEFCSILSKCTMGMWRMTKVAKKSADLFCKLKLIYDYINPQFGDKPDPMEIENAQGVLQNPTRFQKRSESWMNDYNFNRDLMSTLCRMDYDENLGRLVDSKAASYFGYDPTMRQVKFEVALNTVLQLKDYNDFMIEEIDVCLKRLFIDWVNTKSNTIGGLGKMGEAKLALLNQELGATINRKEHLELENITLTNELELANKKINDMLPDSRRAKELHDRNVYLTKTLQETESKLANLEVSHTQLQEVKQKLETQVIIQSASIESIVKENIEKKKLIDGLQFDLNVETNTRKETTSKLSIALERERARLYDLVSITVQTEPLVFDVSTQTDFVVPPMSLRHRVSSDIPKSVGLNSKKSFFPVVTPSITPPVTTTTATLRECYPENQDLSLTTDELDLFGNSTSVISFKVNEMDGSLFSRPTSRQTFPPSPSQSILSNSKKTITQYHEVGLPSVWSEDSVTARPASASLSSSLFHHQNQNDQQLQQQQQQQLKSNQNHQFFQGTYERSNPSILAQNNSTFSTSSNDFHNWESSLQHIRPKTTESQSNQSRDSRFHLGLQQQQQQQQQQIKSRPLSSARSSYGSSTSQKVEDILSSHQLNQLHKSKRFLSSR